jgi:hypothetical protein
MSTTTRSLPRRAVRFLLAGGLVLGAWFFLVAVGTLVAEPTRSVVVFAPGDDALRALAHSDALIVSSGDGFVIAHGQRPGFVRALYAGGAWLVLPASAGGCRGSAAPMVSASTR